MRTVYRRLQKRDISGIVAAFAVVGWPKPASQFERYLAQQHKRRRVVLVAFVEDVFAGYVTLNWRPRYRPLFRQGIPEIQDLNVLPEFRRQGIATRLMDDAEHLSAARCDTVGISVGLYADYGAAQRMYALRGYIPDGLGISHNEKPVRPGHDIRVDDDLVLHLTKKLRP